MAKDRHMPAGARAPVRARRWPSSAFLLLASLPLTACGSLPDPVARKTPQATLPQVLVVDDGGRQKLQLHLRSVVESGRLSSGFGTRGNVMGGGGTERHQGLDIAAPRGTPVRAAAEGKVVATGLGSRYGRYIRIRHSASVETFYAHLSRYADKLRRGKDIERDEVIGYVGSTGRSTGPHLHFELRRNGHPVDPLKYRP